MNDSIRRRIPGLTSPAALLSPSGAESPVRFPGDIPGPEDRKKWEEGLSRTLHELCGDEEGLEEMIAAFLTELPDIRCRAALLLAEGKTAEAAREYHKLKGMLSYLAGKEESDLARRAETEARHGTLRPGGDTVMKLERFLDAFGRFLRERGKPGE